MGSQDIYVSISPEECKSNKVNILSSQMDILNSIKHLQKIKKIQEDKSRMKILLMQIMISLRKEIDEIEQKLPKVKTPKAKSSESEEDEFSEKLLKAEKSSKNNTIERELLEIQEKLRRLNS